MEAPKKETEKDDDAMDVIDVDDEKERASDLNEAERDAEESLTYNHIYEIIDDESISKIGWIVAVQEKGVGVFCGKVLEVKGGGIGGDSDSDDFEDDSSSAVSAKVMMCGKKVR